MTSQGLRDNFIPLYHGGEALLEDPPYSARTVRRQLIRNRLSIKAMERRHILRDDALGIRFLDSIADINPLDLIEIDEVSFAPKDIHQRMGWAPDHTARISLLANIRR